MLTLSIDLSPRWITLCPGVEVQVRPMHNGVWMAAQETGAVSTAIGRDANDWAFALGVEVAKRLICDWRGVGDQDGQPLAVSPEAIAALLHMRDPFDAFFAQVIGPWMGIIEEKKGFAPLSDGISAGAPAIATTAPAFAMPARAKSTRRRASKA